ALHSMLDSLVDHDEDLAAGERGLIDCYRSPLDAATRMRALAREALRRAVELPDGGRHALIVAAMTSFYLCELHGSSSPYAQLVAPSVLEAFGGLAAPTMAVLGARRLLRRGFHRAACRDRPSPRHRAPTYLENQVPEFPLFIPNGHRNDALAIRADAHSVLICPPGGQAGPPVHAKA
ncbi:MAG TPA: DUF2600 family protein, partial [Solirubrobacteraceae bacterium]